jgi:hypothetical protein
MGINVKTSFDIRPLPEMSYLNPYKIMQKFLIQGYEKFILAGSPLDKLTNSKFR